MRVVVSVVVAFVLAACSMGTDEPSTVVVSSNEPLSTVTLRWSVKGSDEPSSCAAAAVDRIDISITSPDTDGELEAFQQRCEAFATSLTLASSSYAARARLIDAEGKALTKDVAVPSFTLSPGDDLVQIVDFPAASFF